MCRLQNIAMRDYQESVTTGQTHTHTDRRTDRQTPDKVIPMCRYVRRRHKNSGSILRNAFPLRNIAMRDYQESVTSGQTDRQTDGQTDAGQSDTYVPLCFASYTKKVFRVSHIFFLSENKLTGRIM